MENLLESNERTLVMLDSVCSGLSACLSLVHADIKQMTEHRNRLAILEQEQIQAKLLAPQELTATCDSEYELAIQATRGNNTSFSSSTSSLAKRDKKSNYTTSNNNNNNHLELHDADARDGGDDDEDPHHLSKLKLLDKRLADSFSHALSMNDLQKSSIHAKHRGQQSRPSIFQVLLGKSASSNAKSAVSKKGPKQATNLPDLSEERPSNKTIIDDINRQTRLAMQYSKQLETHLLKVEDLRTRYEMHLKMGLVVKSVAKAYLTSGISSSSNRVAASTGCKSPQNALSRRHHCSSLVINNDSTPLATHSSFSSLNLSTWSSSSRSRAQRARQEAIDKFNSNNMYVSTISLNSKNHRRLSLAKLISANRGHQDPQQQHQHQQHQQQADPCSQSTGGGLSLRVSSQQTAASQHLNSINMNSPNCGHQAFAHQRPTLGADWTLGSVGVADGAPKLCDTLSKSSVNLSNSHASHSSLKRNKSSSKTSGASKTTIKEFIENIDRIEAEFESYMGSFLLAIEDIQGFARVCQGDVFEITIKYGDSQKFKTKVSVLKDSRQKCDNRQVVFKARIADVLAIKAHECKGLGKRVLLGHKLCETRDLFTARSQLMTISLNQTGSIKLNLIVTWNPLHLAPNSTSAQPGLDISHISLPPTPVSSSTLSSVSSASGPSLNGATTTINISSSGQNPDRNNRSTRQTTDEQRRHNHRDPHCNSSMYQAVDPTYGYYIPPPDYTTSNEVRY